MVKAGYVASHSSLLTVYRSVICSKLYYGSVVYGSARKSYLSKLEPVANATLELLHLPYTQSTSIFWRTSA